MSQTRPKKCCVICSDTASGFNYGVLTCLSCQVFFRRNAVGGKRLACPFTGNCQITSPINRRFCASCRLKKCISSGMQKDWILAEKEKRLKKERAEQNNIPKSFQNSSKDAINLDAFAFDQSLVTQNEFEALLAELDLTVFAPPPHSPLLSTPLSPELSFFTQELLEPELLHLHQLLEAGRHLRNPYRRILTLANYEVARPRFIPQYLFRRLLSMTKQICAFKQLPVECQAKLVKNRLVPMLEIRSVAALYSPDRDAWFFLDDLGHANILVAMTSIRPFCSAANYARGQALHRSFREEWRDDPIIIDLLTVIVLFAHAQEEHLCREYNCYTTLLHRYLTLKYSLIEASEFYNKLLAIIEGMSKLHNDILRFFQSYRRSLVAFPFFVELLDLQLDGNQQLSSTDNRVDHFAKYSILDAMKYV